MSTRKRDSAAIARHGESLSVEERERRYKKDKRQGLDSCSGEFWGLRGAANPGREGSEWVAIWRVPDREQERDAEQRRLGSDRRIKQTE
jgi:hypothetical protein